MNWFPRILIIMLLSVSVAFGLSFIARLDESVGVFRTVRAQPVNESNIVDVVSGMQLHLRVRRVEVSHAIVSIDLLATKATANEDAMHDLYEIPGALFSASTNINQVLVRVMDAENEPGAGGRLLVASDARREKWLPDEPKLRPRTTDEISAYLDSHYRMTYTPRWQEKSEQKS